MVPGLTKYNMMVVANASYFAFCELLVRSFMDNVDLDRVDKFFLVDVGLKREHVEFFSRWPRIHMISTDLKTSFSDGGTWGTGWQRTVAQKTLMLKQCMEKTQDPIVMIDADCIVVKDFSDLIDSSYDIQIAHRPSHTVPYLASFVIAHQTAASRKFVQEWTMEVISRPIEGPREGPAFCAVADRLKKQVRIGCIERRLVSAFNEREYSDGAYIIHLKGKSKEFCRTARDRSRPLFDVEFADVIERYVGHKKSRAWSKRLVWYERKIDRMVRQISRAKQKAALWLRN